MQYINRLKDMREDRDLKQSDIAELLCTTQEQISKYETGKQAMGINKYEACSFFTISALITVQCLF